MESNQGGDSDSKLLSHGKSKRGRLHANPESFLGNYNQPANPYQEANADIDDDTLGLNLNT